VFSAHGYTTGGFTANLGFVGHQTGLGKGFGTFQDFPRSWSQVFLTTTFSQTEAVRLAYANWRAGWLVGVVTAFHPRNLRLVGVRRAPHVDAGVIVQRFRTWRPAKGPWFAMLNMMDAHAPYDPPEPYRSRFGTSEHDRYDGAIVYLDSVVGALVRELPSNTVIVITADHGEQWGERGFTGHGNTLYLPVVHVPLVIAAANGAHGVRVDAPVTLRDVAATMLDLAGLPAELPGASLRHVWLGGTASPVFLEATQGKNVDATNQTAAGSIRGLLDSAAQYLVFADRREELYRWRTDDTTNVASDVDLPSYRQRLGAHYAR
jgi:arylsulfatase A-like enzyme